MATPLERGTLTAHGSDVTFKEPLYDGLAAGLTLPTDKGAEYGVSNKLNALDQLFNDLFNILKGCALHKTRSR